ncbi:MAG: hypothetical protein HYR96_05960 [Deltaproteobacteria bacterium]|nr:hypothetical protein [Deltaproteobacteria bacterium]MBI3296103.1 hypothetical protein [Deltaproteobacteria bacterium]
MWLQCSAKEKGPPVRFGFYLGFSIFALCCAQEPGTKITGVSTEAAGTYTIGETLAIRVQFSSAVAIEGAPTLSLAIGSNSRIAWYESGHGTDTLTFRYLIYPGDETTSLGFASIDALSGDIRDAKDTSISLALPSTSIDSTQSVVVSTLPAISVGAHFSCYAGSSGALKCWGRNTYGQLGQGHTNPIGDGTNEMGINLSKINLGTDRTVKQVSAGWNHVCGLLDDGSVKCWGQNTYGQLGQGHSRHIGDNSSEMADDLIPIDLGSLQRAILVSAGGHFSCVLLENGSVKCWGRNHYGQLGQGHANNLGDGAGEMGDNLPAIDLGGGRTAKYISAGTYHACALLDNDSVKCWGYNVDGQLGQESVASMGDGANEMGDSLASVNLGTGRKAKLVSAGSCHSCVFLDDDSMKCWGNNDFGQLGLGHTSNIGDGADEMGENLLALDFGSRRVRQPVTGFDFTCALLDNGTASCWGINDEAQLGLEHTNNIGDQTGELGAGLSAISLGSGRSVRQISAGNWSYHTCALLDNGTAKCWGHNQYGQLGQGHTNKLGDGAGEMGDNLSSVDTGP